MKNKNEISKLKENIERLKVSVKCVFAGLGSCWDKN